MGNLPHKLWRAIFEFICPLTGRKRAVKATDLLDKPYKFSPKFDKPMMELVELANLLRLRKRLQPIVLAVVFSDILLELGKIPLEGLYRILSSNNSTMKGAGVHTQRQIDTDV